MHGGNCLVVSKPTKTTTREGLRALSSLLLQRSSREFLIGAHVRPMNDYATFHGTRAMRTTHATDRGFTVLELMIVVLVISLLMAVAIPSFFGARARSQDRISQVNLTTGVKAEIAFSSGGDGFTAVSATLAAAEPSLDWSGMADESLTLSSVMLWWATTGRC